MDKGRGKTDEGVQGVVILGMDKKKIQVKEKLKANHKAKEKKGNKGRGKTSYL